MIINTPWWLNRKIAIAAITTTVATATTILRFMGGFETLELKRYDYFFTKRAIATWDERIVIIGYTDQDAQKYGESPSDEILRRVLEKVQKTQPITVGLLFDRNTKPDNLTQRELLTKQLQLMPNLIQSDNDDKIPREPDNITRKITLYKHSLEKPHIVWKIAKHYLKNTGASIKENKKMINGSITINYPDGNQATIKPLTLLNDGGYHSSIDDLMNFPVLISWPLSAKTGFEQYSFDDFLNHHSPNFSKKIIIIGEMKERNIFKAPIIYDTEDNYSFLHSSEVVGIIVSNILQQGEVPFVQTWSDPIEYLYLYGWLIASGIIVLWLCEELDPSKKWAKYLFSIAITWGIFLLSIYTISLAAFPKTWIPSVFVGRGVTFTIFFGSLVCLELKVREEQQKQLKYKEEKLQQEQKYKNQLKIEVKELQETLLAQERLAFFGKLSPFVRHEIIGLYDDFYRKIDRIQKTINQQEEQLFEVLPLLEEVLSEDEWENYTESLLNSGKNVLSRLQEMEIILDKSSDLMTRFFPFVREDSNDDFIDPSLINLNELLRECSQITTYNFIYSKNQDDFDISIVEDFETNLLSFWGVHSELRFIFVNLIENAYYAVLEKKEKNLDAYLPRVWLKTQYLEQTLQVIIQDNGIGIKPEFVQQIFNPLFTTKKKYKQTGVGLSLTKDLLNINYNASIEVTLSEELTCFTITFPLYCPLPIQ